MQSEKFRRLEIRGESIRGRPVGYKGSEKFQNGSGVRLQFKRGLTLTVFKESRWVVLFPLKGGGGSQGFLADNPPAPQSALAMLILNHLLMILTGSC